MAKYDVPHSYPSLSLTTISWHPSTDKSAFVGALGFRNEIVKPMCSLRPRKADWRSQCHTEVADSLTVVPGTDLERALFP